MNKEEAVAYLERKGEISEVKRKLTKEDERKVKKVMKEGKIYGDPCFEIA
jgi:hypothetical protein